MDADGGAAAADAMDADDGAPAAAQRHWDPDVRAANNERRRAMHSTIMSGLLSVIETARSSVLPDDDVLHARLDGLRDRLEDLVWELSRARVLVSYLINLALAYGGVQGHGDLGACDQGLYHAAFVLVSVTARGPGNAHPFLRWVYETHFAPQLPAGFERPNFLDLPGYRDPMSAMAREMATNHANFDARVSYHAVSVLRYMYGANKQDTWTAWHGAVAASNGNPPRADYLQGPNEPEVERTAFEMALVLRNDGAATLRRGLLHVVDAHNAALGPDDRAWKGFSLAPLHGIQRYHATVNQTLLDRWGFGDVPVASFFAPRPGWNAGVNFTTDATRASLPYWRPRVGAELGLPEVERVADEQGVLQEVPTRILGDHTRGLFRLTSIVPGTAPANAQFEAFDTGRNTLLYGSKGTTLHRGEWELWRGTLPARKELERAKRRVGIHEVEAVHAAFPFKTASTAAIEDALRERLQDGVWGAMWAFYGSRRQARRRFDGKMKATRAWARMANRILGPDHRRIAVLGNAVFNASSRGIPPTPTKSMWRRLAQWGLVVLVDEYLTSAICAICHSPNFQHQQVWSIKHCTNSGFGVLPACGITWQRDRNAALNIATIYEDHMAGRARPEQLRRPLQA